MEIITSKDNSSVKAARKLLKKKYRTSSYLIEGFHLLEEAVKSGAEIRQIFVEESKFELIKDYKNVTIVTNQVLKSLADSENPQGVIAEIGFGDISVKFDGEKYLILENVQDPGNVGTMVRTADAAGFDGVLLVGETADIYSPKVLRSMQGSHFHLPIVKFDGTFDDIKNAGLELLVTTLSENSVSHKNVKSDRFALVMGNEGSGVSDEAIESADQLVHIDMAGKAESLNVAVAAGILMFSL